MNSDVEWHIGETGPEPYVKINGVMERVLWAPMEGSQRAFLSQDDVLLVLYESGRGVGKTLTSLCNFLSQIHFGKDHKGLFIRKTHPELAEAISLGRKWLPLLVPGTTFNRMGSIFEFPTGSTLWMCYAADLPDAEARFMGHAYTEIIVDESASYPDLSVIKFLLSCLRSGNPKIKLKMRLLTNPFGVGRAAHMRAFKLPLKPGTIVGPLITDPDPSADDFLPPRRVVHGHLGENLALASTDYLKNILGSTDDPSKKEAWAFGSWAEPSESMFGDLFATYRQFIEVPTFVVPQPDKVRVSFDHGTAAPAAAIFTWENRYGEDITMPDGMIRTGGVRGDLYMVGSLYLADRKGKGLNLPISEMANRVRAYCIQRGWPVDILRRDGNVLDSACFATDGRPSIDEHYRAAGLYFEPCSKGPGSRAMGATLLREALAHTVPSDDGERLKPGLFICADVCVPVLESLPFIQRSAKDPSVWEDKQADHILDAVCYRLQAEVPQPTISGRIDQVKVTR